MHRQVFPFILGTITPEMVNAYTALFKAYFICIYHLLKYLQLANTKAWILGCNLLHWEQWREAARQGSLLSTRNSPADQRESRAGRASLSSFGGDTQAKCMPGDINLFFHLLGILPSFVGTGDSSLKIAKHHVCCIAFLWLISCCTAGVFPQIRITGVSLHNGTSLFTIR